MVFALALPVVSLASEFGSGPSFVLPSGRVVEGNMYAGGGTVNLLGGTGKDAMVAAGTVLVTGNVTENLMAVGGNVTVTGPVGKDVRVAGGSVSISAPVGGELLAAAGQLNIGQGSIVGGDAYLAGNKVVVDGALLGNVRIAAQEVTINGAIGKNVNIEAQKIIIGSQAVIAGNLTYRSPSQAQIVSGAQVRGETKFTKVSVPQRYSWGNALAVLGLTWLLKLVATLVVVFVFYFLFPRLTADFATRSAGNFWRELLRGLIVLVVAPIAIFILFISFIGWMLALVGLLAYLLLLFVASAMSIFTMSGVLQKYVFKKGAGATWQLLLLSTLAIFILGLIPVVGWLIAFGFFLASLGTLTKMQYAMVRRSDQ